MVQTLIAAGIACIMAAVVGGGLKAFSIEIPGIKSGVRQTILGVIGVILVAIAIVIEEDMLSQKEMTNHKQQETPTTTEGTGNANKTDNSGIENEQRPDDPPSYFPEESKRVYTADFTSWPRPNNQYGTISLGFGNSLVLEPSKRCNLYFNNRHYPV